MDTTIDETLALARTAAAACHARRWADAERRIHELLPRLPPRLGLLARAILDFIDEGDLDLAEAAWEHLEDAITFAVTGPAPHAS